MTAPAIETRFAAVEARYDEPHRRHHGREHLAELAAELDAVRDLLEDPLAFDLARRWHDAVYVVAGRRAQDDEAARAELMRSDLAGLVDEATL